ncbi:MAG: glycoside hydrolase family 43 protein [Pseudomonadota bacterium]
MAVRNGVSNPILRGFNPDPSICRVGSDFYVAVSTFEWYPGVLIYHSHDLARWRLVARPLDRAALLDLRGVPDSCGVWAPCLSYADGRFWLCYTAVKRFDGNFKDTHNYLTTCEEVDGVWSDPIYLNSSGFDPSLFHDQDGKKWLTNMVWDHRGGRSYFYGIVLQEFCVEARQLTGERRHIFRGTALDCTEGPHLYRFGDYYYLITAEGGTGYGHAVTMARAKAIDGEYEADPSGPLLTAADAPEWPLQRAGHGDLVETEDGELYLVHLCGRPLPGTRRCPLGRETAIQRVRRTPDGWMRLAGGGHLPSVAVELSARPFEPTADEHYEDFRGRQLPSQFQWLRTPDPSEFMSLEAAPGRLRLYGKESPGSLFSQALIARRQMHFVYEASTCMRFEPENFQQMAGLICYYNSSKFYYLYVSCDEDAVKHLSIMSCEANRTLAVTYPVAALRVDLPPDAPIWLRASVRYEHLNFDWSEDGEQWRRLPVTLDYSVLSDEAGMDGAEQFTGAFVGMTCNDLCGAGAYADFESFAYRGRD